MRLDLFLVEKGYFKSRSKAKAAIEANNISINGNIANKSSLEVNDSDKIEILGESNPYVSRGGLKLEAAIKELLILVLQLEDLLIVL